jgi:Tfp pilus assembly protein PilE
LKTIINFIASWRGLFILMSSSIVILVLIRLVLSAYSLYSDNYKIDQSALALIDSFKQQGRYFANTTSKGSGKDLSFISQNGYSFTIENEIYEGAFDKSRLTEKLMHHDLDFVVYSDSNALKLYRSSKTPIGIDVLQIEIAGEKYIDINKVNVLTKERLQFNSLLFFPLLAVIVFLVATKMGREWLIKNYLSS